MVAQPVEPQPVPESPARALAALRSNREAAARVEVERYRLTCEYVGMNLVDYATGGYAIHDASFGDQELLLAGEGAPLVSEFAVVEYASALGMTTTSGKSYVGAVMEVCYRLPATHARVMSGQLPWARARAICDHTSGLLGEGAAFVDSFVAPVAAQVSWRALDRLCEEAILRWDPDQVDAAEDAGADPRRFDVHLDDVGADGLVSVEGRLDLQDALDLAEAINRRTSELRRQGATEPDDVLRTLALGDLARNRGRCFEPAPPGRDLVVHVHLPDLATQASRPGGGVAECDTIRGPLTLDQVKAWAGNPQAKVVVKPVVDLVEQIVEDYYRPSARLATQVRLRDRTCVFPGCDRPAELCDLDHIVPYNQGGETSTENLACLCRRHHRAKTHGGFTYRRIGPAACEWKTPHGYRIVRDHHGTHPVQDP